MEPTAQIPTAQYDASEPVVQTPLPEALLDRVLGREPLKEVLKMSSLLMELHLGLTDCSVQVGASHGESALGRTAVRELKGTDGLVLGSVLAKASPPPDSAAGRQLDAVCKVLSHALEHDRLRSELDRLSRVDAITGMRNRKAFEQAIASRLDQHFVVMWLDLDRFKEVNDSLGHSAGNELLRHVATRIEESVPPGSIVARIGGDEFAVLLSGCDESQAVTVARHLLDEISEPFQILEAELFITASVGIVIAPDHGQSVEEVCQNADTAMYLAKNQGRNSAAVYSAAAGQAARTRLELGRDLRRALARKEFELHFQPQVDMNGQVRCFEALIRWNHPERGLLFPGHFIDIAEETGLIVPLGAWVMEEACRKCALWNTGRTMPVKVAVNVSALQFYFSDLAQVVRDALESSNLAPELLEIELTESLLLRDTAKCLQDLASLRALGVSVAIDDFGAGYSCLSYLQRLPVDVLKIDRSFFMRDREEKSTAAVVGAITGLAHGLGLQVVAEGIEEPHQMTVLRQLRVDLVQGYLFGRPRPMADSEPV